MKTSLGTQGDWIERRVITFLAERIGCPPEDLSLEDNLRDLPGIDSLETVELVMAFAEEFETTIRDEDVAPLNTIGDLVNMLRKSLP